jgi:hypothetical protein
MVQTQMAVIKAKASHDAISRPRWLGILSAKNVVTAVAAKATANIGAVMYCA